MFRLFINVLWYRFLNIENEHLILTTNSMSIKYLTKIRTGAWYTNYCMWSYILAELYKNHWLLRSFFEKGFSDIKILVRLGIRSFVNCQFEKTDFIESFNDFIFRFYIKCVFEVWYFHVKIEIKLFRVINVSYSNVFKVIILDLTQKISVCF